jgi:hypothetical protein
MRILQISVICIIISLSCCIEIFAQTSDCIRACNEVFDRDIKSLFTSFSRDELKAQFSEYFSFEEKERRNMQRSSSGSTAFGAVIKGTPIDFSSNKDRSSNFALLKSLFLEYQSTQRINDITLNELLQSSIPDAAFQSYNNCINQCGGLSQNENVQLSVLAKDPDTYIVSIRSKSQVGNQPVTISNVQVAGGFLLGESLIKEGQKIQSSSDVSGLLRRSDENVSLVINFQEAGVNSLRWQGSAPKPPVEDPYFSLVPVGTIIFSVLDYQSFCDANGMPTVFSITNSTWAPCDGRSVSGSKYASRITNVPDLRGYLSGELMICGCLVLVRLVSIRKIRAQVKFNLMLSKAMTNIRKLW